MVRLIVAVVVGAVLAVGATIFTANVMTGLGNGTPTTQSLYNYGNR